MTDDKAFKRRVRARMEKTGERYTTARGHLADSTPASTAPDAPAGEPIVSEDALVGATGRSWEQWFAILDAWGGTERPHGEIARHLADAEGVEPWWTQTITVGYERARGIRVKHQRADGVFAVSTSKTIAASAEQLFGSVVDDARRGAWLGEGSMDLRTAREPKVAHFDWEDGRSRVHVWFTEKGPRKTTVAVQHERLDGAEEAAAEKARWTERLVALKSLAEG